VVANTHKAAMQDHRFNPMSAQEIAQATISISILSHLRPQPFVSEADLLDRVRSGMDGLMIRQADHRALFLPKVWTDLPSPRDFLGRLKQKAGLPAAPLAGTTTAFRFTAETFA
jgi:AmmeMemoRadiSam system protein A